MGLGQDKQRTPEDYYLPDKESLRLDKGCLEKWYGNLLLEISEGNFSDPDLKLLRDRRNYYGKYLDPLSRKFFLNHFARNLIETAAFLTDRSGPTPRILEVGSGCGNQLLLFSLLGAEVVGCDIREDVCALVLKRKEFYEQRLKRSLNITLICKDVFKENWSSWGSFDAINFLFSFNDLQPSEKMLELVDKLLRPGGRVVFQETNPSNYYNRLFRRRDSMTPRQVVKILKGYNFSICSLKGGYALPPIFWRLLPGRIPSLVDRLLCRSLFMSPSYHLMAEKS